MTAAPHLATQETTEFPRQAPPAARGALILSVLALATTGAVAVVQLGSGSSAESAIVKRLGELSAQVATLRQEVRANAAARAEEPTRKPDPGAWGALEARQAQLDEKVNTADRRLAELEKEVEALRGAASSALTVPVRQNRPRRSEAKRSEPKRGEAAPAPVLVPAPAPRN